MKRPSSARPCTVLLLHVVSDGRGSTPARAALAVNASSIAREAVHMRARTKDAMLATATLRVNETFFSLQGEGSAIGTPAFFIRLDGCPLRCSWCDTPYALAGDSGRSIDVDALVDLASSMRHIVITGGEPLAQDIAPLVGRLSPAHHVTVETS